MRDNWLSNRVFKSYDDLVDHCCEAWNKLVDQPWRMSIGLRQWAHGFLTKGSWYQPYGVREAGRISLRTCHPHRS